MTASGRELQTTEGIDGLAGVRRRFVPFRFGRIGTVVRILSAHDGSHSKTSSNSLLAAPKQAPAAAPRPCRLSTRVFARSQKNEGATPTASIGQSDGYSQVLPARTGDHAKDQEQREAMRRHLTGAHHATFNSGTSRHIAGVHGVRSIEGHFQPNSIAPTYLDAGRRAGAGTEN